jgi:DNA-binding response OmpR family regulator
VSLCFTLMTEPRNVLVAEDDPDVRAFVAKVVRAMGHTVVLAGSGREAISCAGHALPDLAVLDLHMPGGDGYEVCRYLKTEAASLFIPVLLLTATVSTEEKVRAIDSGADDYLTKPFHPEELKARIRSLLRMKDLTEQLHQRTEDLKVAQERLIFLLETLPKEDERFGRSMDAVKADIRRLADMIEKLKTVDATVVETYQGEQKMLSMKE